MSRCPRAEKGDRRAEKSLRSRPFVGRSSWFLARFCGLLHRKKELSKTNTKVPVSSHYPPVKCPQNSARTWEISAHAEPAFSRYRCVGRRSSGGRSLRKVGLFRSILELSTSRGFSLPFHVSLGFKLGQTVEKFAEVPRRGDARRGKRSAQKAEEFRSRSRLIEPLRGSKLGQTRPPHAQKSKGRLH